MTFSEILTQVYADTDLPASPTATTVARIKGYVNEGVRMILRTPGLTRLLESDAPFAFASVADQARYVMPDAVEQIRFITERTNDRPLDLMTMAEYRRIEPDPTAVTGVPSHYVPFGRTAVAVQPSDASEIFVDSTDAGDVGTAYLEGIITGGYRRRASVTMTGVTAVSLSTSITSWIELTDWYISAAAVGVVTLHEDASGGTELARIAIGAKRPRYFGFYLWPTPSAAVTYYVDYRREHEELVNDADEPPLPTNFHDLVGTYARMREYEKTGNARYTAARDEWRVGLTDLKLALLNPPDYRPVRGQSARRGRSRLGGWFPADTF